MGEYTDSLLNSQTALSHWLPPTAIQHAESANFSVDNDGHSKFKFSFIIQKQSTETTGDGQTQMLNNGPTMADCQLDVSGPDSQHFTSSFNFAPLSSLVLSVSLSFFVSLPL